MKTWILLAVLIGGGAIMGDQPLADDRASALEAMMEADREFARQTAARGGDGWADFFHNDGIMFPPSGRIDGQDAIRETMKAAFAPENPRLVWDPVEGDVSASGDLGYTIGRWRSITTGADGRDSTLAEGNYVSIWKKNADGEWRVALDIGNRDAQ